MDCHNNVTVRKLLSRKNFIGGRGSLNGCGTDQRRDAVLRTTMIKDYGVRRLDAALLPVELSGDGSTSLTEEQSTSYRKFSPWEILWLNRS